MKRKFGDRKDAKLLRKIHVLHVIMPQLYKNRCDNEAFISECIDLTKVNAYLAKKNADNPSYKYNTFQVMVTAMLKVITLRPKLNRFIANQTMYQRNEISAAFTVKKIFSDDGDEALAIVRAKGSDTIDTIHDEIFRQLSICRSDKLDDGLKVADLVCKVPRFMLNWVGMLLRFLDRHGWLPESISKVDPNYSSVYLTNLGSIGLNAGYHHLSNWGTMSIFVVIGGIKKRPFFDEAGNITMLDSVDLGLTIDERIADGYYYSKSIRLLKKLLENPELLERPLEEEVDYE
ncbi:MAG: 2-oxo acid dehydrogenase subunit E2 [Clostridia bacterium]|nr:2-oxo acid dehydrogenase subunit E2 [Clostridia bacterium]